MIYEFPAFSGKIAHAYTVRTRPFLLPSKGLGTRLVPLLLAPATFPIASWSLGPLLAMYQALTS